MPPKPCPFTIPRLRELYWREGKSLRYIKTLATEFMGSPVGQTAVTRWLKEGGIAIRTRAEASAVRVRIAPATYTLRAKQMGEAWRAKYEAGEMPPPTVNTFTTKAHRAAIAATKGRKMETRVCSLGGCTNTITRPAHQFRCLTAYCCRQHMGVAINRQRKEDKEYQAWVEAQATRSQGE